MKRFLLSNDTSLQIPKLEPSGLECKDLDDSKEVEDKLFAAI